MDFWSTLASFIMGLASGAIVNFFVGYRYQDTQFAKRRQAQRDLSKIREILEKDNNNIVEGRLKIEQIQIPLHSIQLGIGDVSCSFDPRPRILPDDLQQLESTHLPKYIAAAKAQGQAYTDNELYGLKSLVIVRPQINGGQRRQPELVFEPTFYRYFFMLNMHLDDSVLEETDGRLVSIRNRYRLRLPDFEWRHVEKIPLHQWFATVTGVVTADNMLVIAIRSDMQGITNVAGGNTWRRASLSCAEGMIRPADKDPTSVAETPSPFWTVFRALDYELGIVRGEDYSEQQVQLLGIGYDKKRCEPVGVFFLKLTDLPFTELKVRWRKDGHENADLIPVPCEAQWLAKLLLGQMRYDDGKPIRLFSNHQELGALLVAFHQVGVRPLQIALK